MGCLPTSTPGSRFLSPENLGPHSYYYNPLERNGIVYTCKAGHVDLTHLRLNADNTKYLIGKIRNTLSHQGKGFSFSLAFETSRHKVRFTYPENWNTMPMERKEEVVEEIALEIAPYLTFNATTWHEILTWFNVHFIGFEPEFNSSFSWEDLYSNLIGTELAVKVVKENNGSFSRAMTKAINDELKALGAQPKETAIHASEKMRGKWFTGNFMVDTIRKNFDIGLDDGYVTPVLVPGICDHAKPELRKVPTTKVLAKYGFKMKYEISPNVFEQGKMFKAVDPTGKTRKIEPIVHYPIMLDHIKRLADEKYGYIFDEDKTVLSTERIITNISY